MSAIIYLLVFCSSITIMLNGEWGFGFLLMIISSIIYFCVMTSEQNAQDEKERIRVSQMSAMDRQAYYNDKTIDYTILVGEESKKSVGSAVVRGAIGGAILGPVGLAAGAVSGKNNQKTTFTVIYKSGRREVVTVENGSNQFNEYAKYLR